MFIPIISVLVYILYKYRPTIEVISPFISMNNKDVTDYLPTTSHPATSFPDTHLPIILYDVYESNNIDEYLRYDNTTKINNKEYQEIFMTYRKDVPIFMWDPIIFPF